MNTCFSVNNINILVANYFVGLCKQQRGLLYLIHWLNSQIDRSHDTSMERVGH